MQSHVSIKLNAIYVAFQFMRVVLFCFPASSEKGVIERLVFKSDLKENSEKLEGTWVRESMTLAGFFSHSLCLV